MSDGGTVGVLALDGADYQLVQEWGLDNLLLGNHAELETFAYTYDLPHTSEVWPTVATGLHPREHNLTPQSVSHQWENPALHLASKAANYVLPGTLREWIGNRLIDRGAKRDITPDSTAADTCFDDLYQWPGLTDADHLRGAWGVLREIRDGRCTERDLRDVIDANTHDEFLWLLGARGGLNGVHTHALDVFGHTYAQRETRLRHEYERINTLVGALSAGLDNLVILSDHGIQVSWLDDDDPGKHSWRAYIATTLDGELPESVFDVAAWLDTHQPTDDGGGVGGGRRVVSDTTAETLNALYGIEGAGE